MVVLCDTCAVLMLLRIAPAMFTNPQFGCMTIHTVWEEYTRTASLSRKYPWRDRYRMHIKSIPMGALETAEFRQTLKDVKFLASDLHNTRTRKAFKLSPADFRVAAAVLTLKHGLCTAEHDLEDFMLQQFNRMNILPLQLVNQWLDDGLLAWDDERQAVLEEWIAKNERPQPPAEIRRFEKLAGRKYPAA